MTLFETLTPLSWSAGGPDLEGRFRHTTQLLAGRAAGTMTVGVRGGIPRSAVVANCDYVGEGYGIPTEAMGKAVVLMLGHVVGGERVRISDGIAAAAPAAAAGDAGGDRPGDDQDTEAPADDRPAALLAAKRVVVGRGDVGHPGIVPNQTRPLAWTPFTSTVPGFDTLPI